MTCTVVHHINAHSIFRSLDITSEKIIGSIVESMFSQTNEIRKLWSIDFYILCDDTLVLNITHRVK